MGALLALVVDRDAALRARVQERLGQLGFQVLGAVSHTEARKRTGGQRVDLLLSSCSDTLARSAERSDRPVTVALLASGADRLAEGAGWLERGCDDVLALDDDERALDLSLRRVAAWAEQRVRLTELQTDRRHSDGFSGLVGRSAALESIRDRLQSLAPLNRSLWIEGERGVGKTWCARALHRIAAAPGDPFVVLEAHDVASPGWEQRWLEPSSDGVAQRLTMYVSEPASFDAEGLARLQRWVRRFVEDQTPARRIVSGSTLSWDRVVEQACMPEALARELAAARILVPPLRERPEDVAPIAMHFLRSIERVNQLKPLEVSAAALDRLESYRWPGNVRELRHAVEHAAILADGVIDLAHLPERVRGGGEPSAAPRREAVADKPFREAKGEVVAEFERAYLSSLMQRERGNVTAAAREAGMLRSALQRLLRKHGLKSAQFRRPGPARSGPTTREPHPD